MSEATRQALPGSALSASSAARVVEHCQPAVIRLVLTPIGALPLVAAVAMVAGVGLLAVFAWVTLFGQNPRASDLVSPG